MKDKFNKLKKLICKRQDVFSLLLISIILVSFYLPLLENVNLPVDNSDYNRFYYRLGLMKKIYLEYKQFPLRNPFLCGGYPILGDPYVFVLNPLYIFVLIFGEIAGIKLVIFALFIFCAYGMFYFARRVLHYNCIGSVFSCLVFMLNSWGVFQIKDGNCERIYYYLLPWVLAFLIKTKRDKRFAILASLLFSLMLAEGGLMVVPVTIFILLYSLLQVKISSINKRPVIDYTYLKYVFLILLFASLLSAIKIIPLLHLLKMRSADYVHFLGEHSYDTASYLSKIKDNAMNLTGLYKALLDNSYVGLGQMYVGAIPCLFFLLSSIVFLKENWRNILILIIFTILLFGSHSPVDLFKLLWHIHPIVHGIWKLHKYFVFFVFFIISLVSGRLFLLPGKLKRLKYLLNCTLIISGIMGITNMYSLNRKDLEFTFIKHPDIKKIKSFFQVRVKEYTVAGPFDDDISDKKVSRFYWLSMLQGFGVTNSILGGNLIPIKETTIPKYFIDNKYYDELKYGYSTDPMQDQEMNPFYKGELSFLKEKNYAHFNYFSPNKLEIAVQMIDIPDILIINQRYDSGWKCNLGRLINWQGLLGIEVKNQGNYSLKLKYLPDYFLVGLGISFFTIIGSVLFVFHNKSVKNT